MFLPSSIMAFHVMHVTVVPSLRTTLPSAGGSQPHTTMAFTLGMWSSWLTNALS
jgi:hypothetical protein